MLVMRCIICVYGACMRNREIVIIIMTIIMTVIIAKNPPSTITNLHRLILKTSSLCWWHKVCTIRKKCCLTFSALNFKGTYTKPIWIIHWGLSTFWCDVDSFPLCKERYNICMNHALLDRESLDCVLWNSTTQSNHMTSFLYESSM